jgi:hypothetical protein
MSTDACASLVDVAYLYSQLPPSSDRNDRPVQSLLLLLDAAVAVASAIDDNILEDLQALPVDDQNKIKSRLDKIAEKTTQPPPKHSMDEADLGAARPEPFPVDLAAFHDQDFSDGLSPIEHLNRLSGVAPSRPALLPTEENMSDLADEMLGFTLPEGDGVRLITRALELWGAAPTNAQPAAIAQPAEDPTDDELLRTYGAAKRNHQYDGPSDDWPNRAERAATVCGLRAVLARYGRTPLQEPDHVNLIGFAWGREPWSTWLKPGGCLSSAHCELSDLLLAVLARYGRPTFQPIPVSERLPGPDDCTPWRDDPTALSWCWAAKDVYGWEWIQLSMGHLHGNLGGIMPGHGYTHWAPWWAIPLPGNHSPGATEEAGEVKP